LVIIVFLLFVGAVANVAVAWAIAAASSPSMAGPVVVAGGALGYVQWAANDPGDGGALRFCRYWKDPDPAANAPFLYEGAISFQILCGGVVPSAERRGRALPRPSPSPSELRRDLSARLLH
jgi:hypothetical protein